jgi:hypothetical protein
LKTRTLVVTIAMTRTMTSTTTNGMLTWPAGPSDVIDIQVHPTRCYSHPGPSNPDSGIILLLLLVGLYHLKFRMASMVWTTLKLARNKSYHGQVGDIEGYKAANSFEVVTEWVIPT